MLTSRISQIGVHVGDPVSIEGNLSQLSESDVGLLHGQGFRSFGVLKATLGELCTGSLEQSFAASTVKAKDIDAIVISNSDATTGPGEVSQVVGSTASVGCGNVATYFLTGQDCSGTATALALASSLVRSSAHARVLVLVYGYCGTGQSRVSMDCTSVLSDGAVSCVVTADGEGDDLLAAASITLGETGIVGQQQATGLALDMLYDSIDRCLASAGADKREIKACYPTNLGHARIALMADYLDVPVEKFRIPSQSRFGHLFSCGNLINAATDDTPLIPGDLYLLLGWSFGVSSAALVRKR